jgi:hypothetical protein
LRFVDLTPKSTHGADFGFLFHALFGSSAVLTLVNVPRPEFRVAVLLTASLFAGSGCGGGTEKVVSVSGRVTHNDKPVAGLTVSFVPQTATATGVSTGMTDADGKYDLTIANTGRSGAVVGKHKVWVSIPRQPVDYDKENKKAGKNPAPDVPADVVAILKKYGSLDKTPLSVEVNGNQPLDLKLD